MHDPFPLHAPALLSRATQPLADYLSFTTLPLHIHEVLLSALAYQLINTYVSPFLSSRLFPRTYPHLNARTKINWDVHVVSLFQSVFVCALALWTMAADEERKDMNWRGRVWGYTGAGGLLQACASGYFLWDLLISTRHIGVFGLGLWAHAVSALLVYSLGFAPNLSTRAIDPANLPPSPQRPFVNHYGPIFILYELSSPFLNIHWFCDKLSLTGSKLQLYNGILLMTTFFLCRLVWGSYQSFSVFRDIWTAYRHGHFEVGSGPLGTMREGGKSVTAEDLGAWGTGWTGEGGRSEMMRFAKDQHIPYWLPAAYLGSNLVLNTLNWVWFGKMIETIRKRFDPPFGTKGVEDRVRGRRRRKSIEEKRNEILVEGIDVDTDSGDGDEEEREVEVSRGADGEGRRSIEVKAREVRKRRKA
ncbi:hypothetical protein H2201_002139 [Coniosporium apollinis]|uniref:TLC domain-containing protein n=1 Tax=Coniosporium apollinis TaxID=61459 RepID=A0ABQ9NZ05_9PEZI|nr:hypothetical protein H2201_002139 [Coniosporium apollinis]